MVQQLTERWSPVRYNFGTMKEGTSQAFHFTYKGELEIKKLESSCKCSQPILKNNILTVTYTAPKVNAKRRVSSDPWIRQRQWVKITLENGIKDVLYLEGKITL